MDRVIGPVTHEAQNKWPLRKQTREDMHKHGNNKHRNKIRGILMDGERTMEITLSQDSWHLWKLMMISEPNILSRNQATADMYLLS